MTEIADAKDFDALARSLNLPFTGEEIDALREGYQRLRLLLKSAAPPMGLEAPLALRFMPGDKE